MKFNHGVIILLSLSSPLKSYGDKNDLALFLRRARELRHADKKSTKAIHYYKEILRYDIDEEEDAIALLRGEKQKLPNHHSQSQGSKSKSEKNVDPHHHHEVITENDFFSTALFELSSLLEEDPSSINVADEAFHLSVRAAEKGHTRAQHNLATAYATGLSNGMVPMDPGRSLLLEYMSALGGDPLANMAMGYRYLNGIGVTESCEKAVIFYEYAANEAAEQIRKRGYPLYSERALLSEIELSNAKGRREMDPEVIDYYTHLADEGDSNAANTLAAMYLHGTRHVRQDEQRAIHFYAVAAEAGSVSASGQLGYILAMKLSLELGSRESREKRAGWRARDGWRDDSVNSHPTGDDGNIHNERESATTSRAGGTGIYTVPFDVDEKLERVLKLLRYASNRGDAVGILGIGYLHYKGVGVNRNLHSAMEFFQKVAGKHPDAAFYLGEILMGADDTKANNYLSPIAQRILGAAADSVVPADVKVQVKVLVDPTAAAQLFATASQRGHALAYHRLAQLSAQGLGVVQSCSSAVNGFRVVADRGDWAYELTEAHQLLEAGDRVSALRLFARLAAVGIEPAQFNAAHLLMRSTCPAWLHPFTFHNTTTSSTSSSSSSSSSTSSRPTAANDHNDLNSNHNNDNAAGERAVRVEFDLDTDAPTQRPTIVPGPRPRSSQERREENVLRKPGERSSSEGDVVIESVVSIHDTQKWRGIGRTGTGSTIVSPASSPHYNHDHRDGDSTSSSAAAAAGGGGGGGGGGGAGGGGIWSTDFVLRSLTAIGGGGSRSSGSSGSGGSSSGSSGKNSRAFAVSGKASRQSHLLGGHRIDCEARALALYALSAAQGNSESYLRVGDFYYYGGAGLKVDKFEAAVFYQMAADLRHTHAIFNLGIMHEAGDGVQQDFHLAKRFFDQAAEFDADARTPRVVALFLLNSHRKLQDALGPELTLRVLESWEDLADLFTDLYSAARAICRGGDDTKTGIATLKNIFSSSPKERRSSSPSASSSSSSVARDALNEEVRKQLFWFIPKTAAPLFNFIDLEGYRDMYTMAALVAIFSLVWRLRWLRNRIRRLRRDS